MSGIAIAVFGGLFGWLLSVLSFVVFSVKSQNISLLNDHILEIKNVEQLAVEYWLTDAEPNPQLDRGRAAKLNGAMSVTHFFNNHAASLLGKLYDDYIELDQNLFEAATGGEFESSMKQADSSRVISVITCSNELQALLRKSRRMQYLSK